MSRRCSCRPRRVPRLLSLAENYLMNGANEVAKKKLQKLIKEYPDTEYAKKGEGKLKTL